jgi:hypothetical protein
MVASSAAHYAARAPLISINGINGEPHLGSWGMLSVLRCELFQQARVHA